VEQEIWKPIRGYVLFVVKSLKTNEITYFDNVVELAEYLGSSSVNYIRWKISQNKNPIHKCMVYGYKFKDLQKFANGEPLPDILRGIPWEIKFKEFKQSCNDYSSEGK